jgi:uncharacterized delta-60 repeat protein
MKTTYLLYNIDTEELVDIDSQDAKQLVPISYSELKNILNTQGYYIFGNQAILLISMESRIDEIFGVKFRVEAGFDGDVNTIKVDSNGKIYCGGSFTHYKGISANHIVRLNKDGSIDTVFNYGTGFDNVVSVIAIQADGKILLGGYFTTYKGVSALSIIRLNTDGSKDTTLNMGAGLIGDPLFVNAITVQTDGKIVIGGYFTQYGASYIQNIIRLNANGSVDAGFLTAADVGFDSSGYVITIVLQDDGKILVGGKFKQFHGSAVGFSITRLNSDGSKDTGFVTGGGFNTGGDSYAKFNVFSIVLQSDGKILIGGDFTKYNGTAIQFMIRLNTDGTNDSTFSVGSTFSGSKVTDILLQGSKIIAGGRFFKSIRRLNSSGSVDNTFNIGLGFNQLLYALDIQSDGKILAGGSFTSYQGVVANKVIMLNADGSSNSI